ncbi:hypothetical protein [Streptomyces sp. NPDC051677]|uniref:hypothetical protein n=1 Tax=Streptomyces sp. NPDC051677 TaxID=3365669 RepID=UPI0037D76366
MIPRLHERTHKPRDPLAEALGRPVSPNEGLTEYTIVAHWPGLDYFTLDDEQRIWTSVEWVAHLEGPYLEHPFAASPDDDRRAILHLDVRLHPDDRELTGPEWAETAHRLARAAGIEIPGNERGCRWIAVQAQPGRLDLIANLIHLDGAWHAPPADILRRLACEARRIEQDLRLIPIRSGPMARPVLRPASPKTTSPFSPPTPSHACGPPDTTSTVPRTSTPTPDRPVICHWAPASPTSPSACVTPPRRRRRPTR